MDVYCKLEQAKLTTRLLCKVAPKGINAVYMVGQGAINASGIIE